MNEISYYGGNSENFRVLCRKIKEYLLRSKTNAHEVEFKVINDAKEAADSLLLCDPEYISGNVNGVAFAQKVRSLFDKCDIIFISANYLWLPEILTRYIKPAGYFTYPFTDDRFFKMVSDIVTSDRAPDTFRFTSNYKSHTVNIDEIYYFTAQNKKVVCVTRERKFEFYDALKRLERVFGERFLRCHSGFLVNLKKISGIDGHNSFLSLSEYPDLIPISRKYKSEVLRTVCSSECYDA